MPQSDSLDKLIPALFAAKGEFPVLGKDGENPHFKSSYTTLKYVMTTIDPILREHGLFITQAPTHVDGQPALTTSLIHAETQQFLESTMLLMMAKSDPQAQGSGISYGKRYSYMSILGLVSDEDDDGNAATTAVRQERSQVNVINYTNAGGGTAGAPTQRAQGNPAAQEARDALRAIATQNNWDLNKVAETFFLRTSKQLANASEDDVKAYTNALVGGLVTVG